MRPINKFYPQTGANFVKFYLIGISNFVIFTLLLWSFQNIFSIIFASSFASLFSIFYSFVLLKKFVFKNNFRLSRFILFSFFGFCSTIFWAYLFSQAMGPFALSATCAFLVSLQNFILNNKYNN